MPPSAGSFTTSSSCAGVAPAAMSAAVMPPADAPEKLPGAMPRDAISFSAAGNRRPAPPPPWTARWTSTGSPPISGMPAARRLEAIWALYSSGVRRVCVVPAASLYCMGRRPTAAVIASGGLVTGVRLSGNWRLSITPSRIWSLL